jgi:hypothetical protein
MTRLTVRHETIRYFKRVLVSSDAWGRSTWFAGLAKLRIRFERRLDTHYALLKLACAIFCVRFIEVHC